MSAFGWEWSGTVAVALTDLAITSLDEHLALLIDGIVSRPANRLLLRVMDGGDAVVAFSPHNPLIAAVDGYDPLVLFFAHFKHARKGQALEVGASLGASGMKLMP